MSTPTAAWLESDADRWARDGIAQARACGFDNSTDVVDALSRVLKGIVAQESTGAHRPGVCDWCGRGGHTARGLCNTCYARAAKNGTLPPRLRQPRRTEPMSTIERANEVLRLGGTRDWGDLARALDTTPDALARALRRAAAHLEKVAA